ncbi:11722_t:CDS:10 [Scutellospora calospora]|uniref:11722_t:CDS:1 n=1 Tax=Scutellospora calospora TaxID=85575 RepID=A0ACA9KL41_9GLOM|nr:11722_t:CDS:10 [Scutellospora calospora]
MKFSIIIILSFIIPFVLSEDVTKSSYYSDQKQTKGWFKPFVPTYSAPPEVNDVSVPTGTPIIPGLLPGMTEIPAVPGQDMAAANAAIFELYKRNPFEKVIGALIETNFKSTIGVLLDDFSENFGMRKNVADYYLKQNNDFWITKAHMQTILTEYRQVYRSYFHIGKKQLTLPPEEVWEFNLGKARRTKIGNHDYIAVDVDFYSVLVTDAKIINRSEPALNEIGGKWSGDYNLHSYDEFYKEFDHWILPVDPEFLLQRTGYACIDENSYPKHTVESENVFAYYDDTLYDPNEIRCHYSEYPSISCIDALDQNVGSVNVTITWHRIPFTEEKAKKYRFGNHTSILPDLVGVRKNLLEQTRVAYRYYGQNSCVMHEGRGKCIGAPGWRRLLRFTSSAINSGKTDLHLGNATDPDYLYHGVFEWDNCHKHFHFQHYGNFQFGDTHGKKVGFCLQTTWRYFNTEYTYLNTPYDTCVYQGISVGWGDDYISGLGCQWIDITGLPAQTAILSDTLNPDGFLCEGSLILNSSNNIQWVLTNYTTSYGYPVSRVRCNYTKGWDSNNYEAMQYILHNQLSFVTEPCTRGQSGPLRDCGFQVQNDTIECTPGENVTLGFYIQERVQTPSVTVRICESSRVLGSSTHCEYVYGLAITVVEISSTKSNPAKVTFQCPVARDDVETGGLYSILVAPTFIKDYPTYV